MGKEYEESQYSRPDLEVKKSSKAPMIILVAIAMVAIIGVVLYLVLDGMGVFGRTKGKVLALAEYKEFVHDDYDTTVTDEEVNKYYADAIKSAVANGQKAYEKDESVAEDKEVAMKDTINLAFKGYVDGKAFEGGESSNYDLVIGSKSFIDTFEDQLVGMKVGETKDVKVKFPDNYGKTDLAGKDAVFTCTINYFAKEIELTEENAYKSLFGYDSLDKLKKDLKEYLVEMAAYSAEQYRESCKTEYLSYIIDNTTYEKIDKAGNDFYLDYYKAMEKVAADQNMTIEELSKSYYYGSLDEFKTALKEQSVDEVKKNVVLEEIAKIENIKLSDEKYDEMANNMLSSQQQFGSVESYVATYDGYYGKGMFKLYLTNEYILEELYTKYAKSSGKLTKGEKDAQ